MHHLVPSELMVLLVEPSVAQQRIITRMLSELGNCNVSTVKSGGEALEELRAAVPDLVISALYLPDMTGTDLLETMKSEPDLEAVAFILISSETRFRYLDPIRQAGAVAILPKPFDVEELRTALDTTIEHLEPDSMELDDLEVESLHLLIVDDSALMRKHIRRMFSAMGLQHFTEACDGVEAIELIQDNFYDLVVTDYNMPRMDGQELVDRIRSHSGQPSVPILMVTSEADRNRLAAVQKAGVSAICDKPFEPATIRNLLRSLLENAA